MSRFDFHENDETISTVVGIQFSVLSPEEIRKGSVAEITKKDTYVNGIPVVGGLFDPRMGVSDPGMLCRTDGLDYMKTPGYHGHLELARPVFYIQHIDTIKKILTCVCFQCSKIKLCKKMNAQVWDMNEEARFKYVHKNASKVKRCGEKTDDGCMCLQPRKVYKEGLANLIAEWKGETKATTVKVKLTVEIVLKILKRISDEDVAFMGFSPVFSRPDWFVCQVLLIPPPSVRPSVKFDSQQRSEDDLTHILVNIIKSNMTLREKMRANAPANVIDDLTNLLQYFIASMVNNKISGVAPTAQRSGRPMKALFDRLNSKTGRMRLNLMAKRVDYSARSVITADPNISTRHLGVPMKIAMNLTKPVMVNDRNRAFLTQLVLNGAEVWPGAKMVQRANGECINLKHNTNRGAIVLHNGDRVHRHMMNGDAIIFNRQPTLHRMSMMGHIVQVMKHGNTFRMNVSVTHPYNADFDGDEMNLHMPQDLEAESEIRNLAAVPLQMVSPANNGTIIGVYQDSMLGSYLFSKENTVFHVRHAMNMLMMFDGVDPTVFREKAKTGVSSYDILSQILPPLTMHGKVEIANGRYLRGQLDKGVLGARTRGILHRICNDFGNLASTKFIDDLQNVVTEFMKFHGFSVGISDLISDRATNAAINEVITRKHVEVNNLIQQVQWGLFENNTGKTNVEEFETQVNNVLNQATSESGKIGLKSLSKKNRFVTMVQAGSKGSDLNISFMISCLGQQNVDGKRIPYGFEHRTLPHFTKYDDSMCARGFVESSYIGGLTPQELFMHAMGGRVGLIDTAVKTSTTGYIQRRLIKALEDLKVEYDMTIRTNKNKIVQFRYGDDGIDTTKVEDQELLLVKMTTQDVFDHFALLPLGGGDNISAVFSTSAWTLVQRQESEFREHMGQLIEAMLTARNDIVVNVFGNRSDSVVNMPVAFQYLIQNTQSQCGITTTSVVDLSLLDAYSMICHYYGKLERMAYTPPTRLFWTLYFFYLSPKQLLLAKRFHRAALTMLLENVVLTFKRSIVTPGEMVGMTAAQSIGEVSTQMTLNTFHFAGVAAKSNVTRGVARLDEVLSLTSKMKNPSLNVYLRPEDETNREKAQKIMYMLEHTRLVDLVVSSSICFDPDDRNTLIDEDRECIAQYLAFESMLAGCGAVETGIHELSSASAAGMDPKKMKWIIRLEMDAETMLEKNITMDDVRFTLAHCYGDQVHCIYSDFNSDKLVFRVRINSVMEKINRSLLAADGLGAGNGKEAGSGSAGSGGGAGDGGKKRTTKQKLSRAIDPEDHVFRLRCFQEQMLQNIVLRGVKGIRKVNLRKVIDNVREQNGAFEKQDIWVLDTVGTNLQDVLALPYIDSTRTVSNNIVEMYDVLGIEATRQAIYNELVEVVEFDSTYINYHNYSVLVDRMTYTDKIICMFRHGINNDNTGPIAKASFEETPKMFLKAARHAELDMMRGISANVMCGQEGYFGTSAFQVLLDVDQMQHFHASSEYVAESSGDAGDEIESFLASRRLQREGELYREERLQIQNSADMIRGAQMGQMDEDYNPGF